MRAPDVRHILFVHASDELYGADRILLEIVRGLDARRFRATVVVPNDVGYEGKLSAQLAALGVPVHRMKLAVMRRRYFGPGGVILFAWRLVASAVRLARLIQREQVDLVHSHTSAVFSGAFAARLARRPHLWHVSEIVTKPRAVRRGIAWMLPRLSDRVVTVSEAVRRHLAETEPRNEAATVIHNGIDPARFETLASSVREFVSDEALRIPPDAPVVGMVGRVGSWKGQELLLEAAPRIAAAVPDARFLLVGGTVPGRDGDMSALRRLVQSRGVDDRTSVVRFTDDVAELVKLMDVFVQPSLLPDPFPTTVLEAMSAAKPVVGTAHGGVTEMIVEGETGHLVPVDASALADRVIALLRDPERARAMGAAGQRRVRIEFTVEAFNAAYAAAYDQLLGRKPG